MKPKDADDFAYALAAEGRASASVRRDIAAASSFFAFIERRYDAIRNPFRGTKARPEGKAKRAAAYPSEAEAAVILNTLAPEARAAAAVMLFRGLRVGALLSLSIRGGRFMARSKGKDISGALPAEALAAIRAAGLDSRRPFAGTTETKLADAIRKRTAKLAEAGTISAAYSAHDFRHLYAVTEYRKDRDLYQVSKFLGHASIQVTEDYLRGLGEVD
jgi:integrase